MIDGRDHQQLLLEEQFGIDVRIMERKREHRQIELAAVYLREQRCRRGVDDHHPYPRILDGHRLEERRDEPARGRADHADAGHARDLAVHRGDVGHERLELELDPPRPLHDGLAFSGELAAGPVDQGDAQLAFEPGDVGRHVGLHGVQRAGGGRERAVVGHGDEGAQLTEVHRQT